MEARPNETLDQFGRDVDVAGRWLVVGAVSDRLTATQNGHGSVTLFFDETGTGGWKRIGLLPDSPSLPESAAIGATVAIDTEPGGVTILSGAPNANRTVLWTIPGDPDVEKTLGQVSAPQIITPRPLGEPSGQRVRRGDRLRRRPAGHRRQPGRLRRHVRTGRAGRRHRSRPVRRADRVRRGAAAQRRFRDPLRLRDPAQPAGWIAGDRPRLARHPPGVRLGRSPSRAMWWRSVRSATTACSPPPQAPSRTRRLPGRRPAGAPSTCSSGTLAPGRSATPSWALRPPTAACTDSRSTSRRVTCSSVSPRSTARTAPPICTTRASTGGPGTRRGPSSIGWTVTTRGRRSTKRPMAASVRRSTSIPPD